MANEDKKGFDAVLHDSKDMPKMKIIADTESIKECGGSRAYFTPPIDYDTLMRRVPFGKVTTVGELRDYFTRISHADSAGPITAGIFVSITAWASVQRRDDPTPYRGTLKANRESNTKYPGGVSARKEKLETEGHTVICRGRKNIRYFVKDYKNTLFDFIQGK